MWGTKMSGPSGVRRYEIRVMGQLDPLWIEWFNGLSLEVDPDGVTRLWGPVADQSALRSVLERIFDLNVPLLSVRELPDVQREDS